MLRNLGKTDKIIRLTAAIIFAILILVGAVSNVTAIILGILAVLLAGTSALSFCPVYALLKTSTAEKPAIEQTKDEKKK
jgi:hypothetical protein